MKKIISKIRRLLRVEYRLSVMYKGSSKPEHNYCRSRRLITRRAAALIDTADYWTLYKTGPFFLPEREVDCYRKGDRP